MKKKIKNILCDANLFGTFFLSLSFFLICPNILFAQSRKLITIESRSIGIQEALDEVKRQGNVSIRYEESVINNNTRLNLSLKDVTLEEALMKICRQAGLAYEIKDNKVLIKAAKKQAGVSVSTGSKGFMPVSGVVKDTNGDPVPGVIVNLEGTLTATTTDIDGKYVLQVPDFTTMEARITFSLIGMKKMAVKYDGKKTLDVIMENNDKQLTEVVVTGYQDIDKRDMVGAYTKLKGDDIKLPSYTSVDQMLQGRVAGMIVSNTSTRVGAAPKITLRGTSTIMGTTSPLWVVDGIVQQDVENFNSNSAMLSGSENDLTQYLGSAISWLNPNDIENITVLKDASATAIYGSRASNGVIVITTKKGKAGRLSVNYSTNLTVSMRPTYKDYYVMNSKERINFSKEAYDAGGYYQSTPIAQMNTYEGLQLLYLMGQLSESEFKERYKYLETVNTDWLDLVTRTAFSHSHNLSVSGGSDNTTFNVSANYSKTQGIEKGNDQENFSGRIRVGFQLSPKVKLDMSLVGTVNKVTGFTAGVSPQSYAITTSRSIPAFDNDGNRLFYRKESNYTLNKAVRETTGLGYNILNEMDNSYSETNSPRIGATLNFAWYPLKNNDLKYEFVGGYTNESRSSEAYADARTYYIAQKYRGYDYGSVEPGSAEFKAAMLPFGGSIVNGSVRSWSYNIQNKLTYTRSFEKEHRLNAMLAWEVRSNHTSSNTGTIFGFVKDKGETITTPPSPDQVVPISGSYSGWGTMIDDLYGGGSNISNFTDNFMSIFASTAYSFRNRYVFNASIRNDFSNRFGSDTNNRLDPNYSLGASWRASEEPFMDKVKPYLSSLNIRLAYGIQGNALTRQSPELILIKPKISNIYSDYVSTISQIPNSHLTWEKTKSWNVGFDMGLFDDKVSLVVEMYKRNSSPVIAATLLPEYGTSAQIPQNGPKLENKGIDVTASFTPVETKDAKLGMTITFSKNWNKVKTADYIQNKVLTTETYLTGNKSSSGEILRAGYPVDGFWRYSFAGLDPQTGVPTFNYMDKTDYTDQSDFLTYAGSKEPVMMAGINLNFSYKQFSLSSTLSANLGGKAILPDPYSSFSLGKMPSPETNLSRLLTERWKVPGDEAHTDIPGVYTGSSLNLNIVDPSGISKSIYAMWAASDARVASASFLRCRAITFSWYIPANILKTVGIQAASLSASMNNIFVIKDSKFKGMDPETGTSVLPKSFTFGMNVSF